MSKTYSLVCVEAKARIWIGQSQNSESKMTGFYSDEPETMAALGEFLRDTQGKPLALMEDCQIDDIEPEEGFKEYNRAY